ncbi:MAG: YkoF family thiamine/hydroxymethylpyrimidine-binding protein [Aggregatilineales bacterium]
MNTLVISAQVSLYPLQPQHLGAVIRDAISLWQQRNLDVWPGTMSTIVAGDQDAVWNALRDAFALATERCETVMVVTVSNACPRTLPAMSPSTPPDSDSSSS